MIVLGINETHCATAAVLRDGAIVGCASEERFSRLKNDAGYPRAAVDALLADLGIERSAIDLVVLAGARAYSREWMNRVVHDAAYARGKFALSAAERLRLVTDHLGITADRVLALDHHTCHAAAAYFGSPFGGADALVLTNDNSGDGLCATATTADGITLTRREAAPSAPGSLGSFYSFVTLLLGMRAGEHEYKVMGLAPYAPSAATERAATSLRGVFAVTS